MKPRPLSIEPGPGGLERLVQLPGSDDLANEVSSALLVIKRRDEHADAHADRVRTCP